jgi:tetratricopeptide (TPR) repeat protein
MSRLTRREIKRDEVLETASRVVGFFTSHTHGLLIGFAAVVLLALGVTAAVLFVGHRKTRANEMLARALTVVQAEVVTASANPNDPTDPTFASAEMRDARALELFEAVEAEFGGSPAGRIAGVYLGQLAARRGDAATARQRWEDFLENSPDHMLASEVRLNLIALDRAAGNGEQVVAELQSMLAAEKSALPQVVVLDELAATLEMLGRDGEALDIYQRIVDEHPTSSYASRAREKLGPA